MAYPRPPQIGPIGHNWRREMTLEPCGGITDNVPIDRKFRDISRRESGRRHSNCGGQRGQSAAQIARRAENAGKPSNCRATAKPYAAERGHDAKTDSSVTSSPMKTGLRPANGALRHQPANRRAFADARALDLEHALPGQHFERSRRKFRAARSSTCRRSASCCLRRRRENAARPNSPCPRIRMPGSIARAAASCPPQRLAAAARTPRRPGRTSAAFRRRARRSPAAAAARTGGRDRRSAGR